MAGRYVIILAMFAALGLMAATAGAQTAASQPTSMPGVGDILGAIDKATAAKEGQQGKDWASPIRLAIVFAGLALLPSLLVMMTSFTRIIIVLGFVRRALTTQTIPPTIALIGLALFLTLFTMSPTFTQINQVAVQPYLADKITFETAMSRGTDQLKDFMIRQTRQSDLALFVDMAGAEKPASVAEVPMFVAIPAFAISEFRTAFDMGCKLFIPFLVIDLVISSILLAAGMMMLPPSIVSLPFKIILFVMVDGWRLIAQALVGSFH